MKLILDDRRLGEHLRSSSEPIGVSLAQFEKDLIPVLQSPPEPASRFLRLLGACENAYFARKKKLISWFDGLSFRIKTTYIVGAVPTIGYHFSEKEIIKEKMPKIDSLDALDDAITTILTTQQQRVCLNVVRDG